MATKLETLELDGVVTAAVAAAAAVGAAIMEASVTMTEVEGIGAQVHEKVNQGTASLLTALMGASLPEAGAAINAAQLVGTRTAEALEGFHEMKWRGLSIVALTKALLIDLREYEGARSRAAHKIIQAKGLRKDATSHAGRYFEGLNG